MSTDLHTLQLPASSSASALDRDFDHEFRLLENRITARLRPRGLARLRAALRRGGVLSPTF